jgi:hypothetical protein
MANIAKRIICSATKTGYANQIFSASPPPMFLTAATKQARKPAPWTHQQRTNTRRPTNLMR